MTGPARKRIPERADLNGITLIMEAAKRNLVQKIVECVEDGHSVNAVDNAGFSALLHAADTGSEEAALMLIHHKADMTHADRAGRTGLVIACENLMDQLVERWVLNEGPLDAQEKTNGDTALMVAIRKRNAWAAVRLVDAGADFETLKNNAGETGESLGRLAFEGEDLKFFKLAIGRRRELAQALYKANIDDITKAVTGKHKALPAPKPASFRKKQS